MIATILLAVIVLGQAADSTYDRWALRLGYGPGSTGVVEGIQARGVGGGTFVPRVDILAMSDDSVRHLDRDTRLDLLLQVPAGGYSIRYVLFLSSLAPPGQLVGEAAAFGVLDC